MKTINTKVKYKPTDGQPHSVDLYARKVSGGKWERFGQCHVALIPYLKTKFKQYMDRITLVKS